MTQVITTLVLFASTGAIMGAGLVVGTRFINEQLRYRDDISSDRPLVRPSRPSGADWTSAGI
jgi:hypothetical protein